MGMIAFGFSVFRTDRWRRNSRGSCTEGAEGRNWLQRGSSRSHSRYYTLTQYTVHLIKLAATLCCILSPVSVAEVQGSVVWGGEKGAMLMFIYVIECKSLCVVLVVTLLLWLQWLVWTPVCLIAPPRSCWSISMETTWRTLTQHSSWVREQCSLIMSLLFLFIFRLKLVVFPQPIRSIWGIRV